MTATATTAPGTLFVVATPIGNQGDISERAITILNAVSLIAAEDTRHSGKLMQALSITTPLRAYHDFSDSRAEQALLKRLQAGESLAMISDAGTPLISDPGFGLVRAARARGIPVSPVPGASSLTAALSVSGLPTDRFVFEGFLPAKSGPRSQRLQELVSESRTLVFFEAPHRIEASVEAMVQILGAQRPLFVARELTKKFEDSCHGEAADCLRWLQSRADNRRGEFVIVAAGCEAELERDKRLQAGLDMLPVLRREMSLKKAVSLASELSGARKNALYQAALAAAEQASQPD